MEGRPLLWKISLQLWMNFEILERKIQNVPNACVSLFSPVQKYSCRFENPSRYETIFFSNLRKNFLRVQKEKEYQLRDLHSEIVLQLDESYKKRNGVPAIYFGKCAIMNKLVSLERKNLKRSKYFRTFCRKYFRSFGSSLAPF